MQLPLNVSPVSASFFGLERLGIHRVLILACLPGDLVLHNVGFPLLQLVLSLLAQQK